MYTMYLNSNQLKSPSQSFNLLINLLDKTVWLLKIAHPLGLDEENIVLFPSPSFTNSEAFQLTQIPFHFKYVWITILSFKAVI